MKLLSQFLPLYLLAGSSTAQDIEKNRAFLKKQTTCTVLANGYESIDDSPAINAAITSCGNGGTIILPPDNNYSLSSQLNFQACKNCDFQLEGQLIFTPEQPFRNLTSFDLTGVQGATIRSLTGQGGINGNAGSWWWTRWTIDSKNTRPDTFFTITGASNITVSNLSIWDWKMRLFRITNSSNTIFSNLNLRIHEAWAAYPRDEAETYAFETSNVTNISISSIDIKYTPRPQHKGRALGACIAFDFGTQNVDVSNITCMGAWSGVIVQGSSVTPIVNNDPIHDIYIRNTTSDSVYNTGILTEGIDVPVYNITWEDIKVLKGVPAVGQPCYLRFHYSTPWGPNCVKQARNKWTDIWFKGYKGTVDHPLEGGVPDQGWGRVNNMSVVDAHFVNWA